MTDTELGCHPLRDDALNYSVSEDELLCTKEAKTGKVMLNNE